MIGLDNVKFINRLAYLIGGLAVFILIFSLIDYGITNWFLVENVIITGEMNHIDSKGLVYLAQDKVQGNLFTLDINEIQEDFFNMPWVKHVNVMREFPNSILVGLSEYSAIARLGDEALIADDGNVFNGVDTDKQLPVFYVAEQNTSEAIADFKSINKILNHRKVKITELALNGFGITSFTLSAESPVTQLKVVICGVQVESEVRLLDQYWDKLYSINPGLNYINMCYKNAFAINEMRHNSVNDMHTSGAHIPTATGTSGSNSGSNKGVKK